MQLHLSHIRAMAALSSRMHDRCTFYSDALSRVLPRHSHFHAVAALVHSLSAIAALAPSLKLCHRTTWKSLDHRQTCKAAKLLDDIDVAQIGLSHKPIRSETEKIQTLM